MVTSKETRVFTLEIVKGCKPTDLCRMVLGSSFDGSEPDKSDGQFSDGYHRHVRVLTLQEAASIINGDIAAGCGSRPLTVYVEQI